MLGGGDRHILLEGVLALEFGNLNAGEVGFALMSIAIIEATQWKGREGSIRLVLEDEDALTTTSGSFLGLNDHVELADLEVLGVDGKGDTILENHDEIE